MSSVNVLQIYGIRSFGPEDEDKATVKFATPLTLILGTNGSGKTTIIEALKYAACGELPSNCKQGAGFIHDPSLCGLVEVRAQTKLSFTDVMNKKKVVVRTMQATQKAKKLEYKTLDSTLTEITPNREKISISSRCADVNSAMCIALGVSKSILNYVIFCHQEDSTWPLDEGKKVKERFDAIFDAVKYNKCLDSIRKLKKEMNDEIKLKKNELGYLRAQKQEAAEKKDKLKKEESRMLIITDRLNAFEKQLGPIREQLSEIASKETVIHKLDTDREKKKTLLKAVCESIDEYKKGIDKEYDGTTDQLKEAISNFQSEFSLQQSKQSSLVAEFERCGKQDVQINKKISDEQLRLGQLKQDEEQNNKRIETRNSDLNKLVNDLELADIYGSVLTEGDVTRTLSGVERRIHEMESNIEILHETGEKEGKIFQAKIDKLREEKARLIQAKQTKSNQLADNKAEAKKVKSDLDEVDQSTEKLHQLEAKLSELKQEIDVTNNSLDINKVQKDILEAEQKRDSLESRMTELEKEVNSLQSLSTIQTELGVLKDSKTTKESEMRKLKNKNADALQQLLNGIPDHGIKHQMQSCIDRLAGEIRKKEAEIREKQKEVTTLETERKYEVEKLRSLTQTLAQDEEELYDVCSGQPYDVVLSEVNTKLQELQDVKGSMSSEACMFRRYVEKLQQEEPCCPLCHREFQAAEEVAELIEELNGKVRDLPSVLSEKTAQVAAAQEKQNRLQQLKPIHERISKVKEVEIPELKSQLETTEDCLNTAKQSLASLKAELAKPQADEILAKKIQGDVVLLDQLQTEIRKLDKEIEKLDAKLPPGGSGRSLQEAMNEQQAVRRELTSIVKTIQTFQAKQNKHNAKLHSLQTEKNRIVEDKLKIQSKVQAKKQLEDKLADLHALEIVLFEEIDRISEQITPVCNKLDEAVHEKDVAYANHRSLLEEERKKLSTFVRHLDSINKIQSDIARYESSGSKSKLESVQKTVAKLERDKEQLMLKRQELQEQIDSLKSELSSQETRKRKLDDNLKLRIKRGEEQQIKIDIEKLDQEIGNLNVATLSRDKKRLETEGANIMKEKAQTEGQKAELGQLIASLRTELNKEFYRDVDKKYKDKLIALKVQEICCEDLNRYYVALDYSIMHFHTEKMKHVNDIVRDLWRQIYCGNDIDTIKIQTDKDTNLSADKRRAFNYRVVQIKNNKELDMRGRCSAGQKVLACLIIRMALAETFSANCGILTLDEPTTNLDKQNIDSLSTALAEIVNSRSRQKNFQLIIITHDEEFLTKLTQVEKLDYYIQVSRNKWGKSVVEIMPLDR